MPSHSETAWLHPVEALPQPVAEAPLPAGRLPLVQRLMGLLAFSSLALGVCIAAREGRCVERHPAEARRQSPSSLSTLAPIMRTGPATPQDAVRRDAACRVQAGRSAKLKPTP